MLSKQKKGDRGPRMEQIEMKRQEEQAEMERLRQIRQQEQNELQIKAEVERRVQNEVSHVTQGSFTIILILPMIIIDQYIVVFLNDLMIETKKF